MGRADIAVKNWLNDNGRFADLFNGFVFNGRKIILPDELEDLDRETDILITDKKDRRKGLQRHRDLVKRWRKKVDLAVLACESQDKVHYAMPVRSMLNDSLTYTDQIREIWRQHEKERKKQGSSGRKTAEQKLTQEEYLSRFRKNDRIFPVINLVFYYDLQQWDGAKDLYDMFHLEGELEDREFLQNLIPNYRINLLDAGNVETPKRFHSDLQQIFGMLKCRGDKNAMREYLHQNRQYFERIDVETYQAVREFMHSERVMKDMTNSRKGTRINMCKALEDIYEEGREEGREEGKEIGRREEQLILISNMLRNGMSAEDIKKYAKVTDEMIAEAHREKDQISISETE